MVPACAPVPLPPVMVTGAVVIYPDPVSVTVTATTCPVLLIVAYPLAPLPTQVNVAVPFTCEPVVNIGGVSPELPATVTEYKLLTGPFM